MFDHPLRRRTLLPTTMSYQLNEQVVHDRVNLLRLVRRLEKSIDSAEWLEDTRAPSRAAWIKTQGVMQVCGLRWLSKNYYLC